MLFPILCWFLLIIELNLGLVYEEFTQTVRDARNSTESIQLKFEIYYELNRSFAVRENAVDLKSPVVMAESTIIVAICGQHKLAACRNKMRFLEDLLSEQLKAVIVFVEHRYYGKSTPKLVFTDLSKFNNLRVLEVLEDIREVVEKGVAEKLNLNETKSEKIWERTLLVGEDYAGALALWMAMAKNGKNRPKFIWSASPSPLALLPDAPLSPRFDHQLAQLLEQFNCQPAWFRSLFNWMDDTAASGANGLQTVKDTMLYKGHGDIEMVKGKVLEWLRQFVSLKNVPTKQKYFTWPLQKLCMELKSASADGKNLATAFATAIKENAEKKLDAYYYDTELLNPMELSDKEFFSKHFQQCTELVNDNCAEGWITYNNDPFFKQCFNAPYHMKILCDKLLFIYETVPPPELQWDFINNTFGFDFGRLENVLITSGQLDQFAFPNDLIKSDKSRNVTVFQSIGLSSRGHELDKPNECDSLAIKQARTQIFDILVCTFHPSKCVPTTAWPYPLNNDSLALDASTHKGTCETNDSDYPWADYANGDMGKKQGNYTNGGMGKKQGMLLTMTMIITFAITALFF